MDTNLTFKSLNPVKGVKFVGEFSKPRDTQTNGQRLLKQCLSGLSRIDDFKLSTQLAIKREFYKLTPEEQAEHPDLIEFFESKRDEFDQLVQYYNNKTKERRGKKPTADFSFLYR